MKRFADLREQEVLALAISNEDEDNLIYRSFADGLRSSYPDTAGMFDKMAEEEIEHRGLLLDLYRKKFGGFLPLIRRQDMKGFVARRPIWLNRPLAIDATRKFAEEMEYETARFYRRAAQSARDDDVRDLLNKLAVAEDKHEKLAHELGEKITPSARATEDQTARRMFMLQYVQPGLAGLMDGSVSTLAPLFAAAFATHNTWSTFLVGLAAAIGAGISMAFAEALSDDGSLTGRGAPVVRGIVCGGMTALGGVGHALPYLILFLRRDLGRLRRRRGRIGRDLLDPHALYGYAVPAGRLPGHCRWRACPRRRHPHWEFVTGAPRDALSFLPGCIFGGASVSSRRRHITKGRIRPSANSLGISRPPVASRSPSRVM
jgi:erythrin-vacuolar iron transport family protein